MTTLRLAPPEDLRLRLGEWGDDSYAIAERLRLRRSWRLNQPLAGALTLFFGGRDVGEGIEAACELFGVSEDRAREAIELLVTRTLLQPDSDDEPTDLPFGRSDWADRGWTSAHDHHMATWDYPFVDYDADGWQRDRSRMASYGDVEEDRSVWDHDRCNRLGPGEALPAAVAAIGDLTAPLHHHADPAPLTRDKLLGLLSVAFGRLPPHRGVSKPRRSSPSGGARHPSEGYLLNLLVPDLPRGVWHVRGGQSDLVWVAELPENGWLLEHFSGLFLSDPHPEALMVVTSVFARNMYRYREPRTLRTVFLDAGHIIATLEMAAISEGIKPSTHHALDDVAVEELLGVDALKEGVVAGVALKGRMRP